MNCVYLRAICKFIQNTAQMKQVLSFIFLNFFLFSYAQNLNLRNSFKQNSELPQNLNKNDIGIIYEINGGWSAYDEVV